MASKYCKYIQSGLNFHLNNIRFCNEINVGPIIADYSKEVDTDLILNKRKEYIENFKNGEVYSDCEKCSFLSDSVHSSEKIDYIEIFHWLHCNCGCIYCANLDFTNGKFSDKVQSGNPNVLRLLKDLYKKNAIDKEKLWVCFGGGEVAVLKEFPKIVDLFLKNNVSTLYIQTSGITYSKTIEKALKSGKGQVQIGISAGSKEAYEKIKRRDKYEQVVKNIKKYVKAAKDKSSVVCKFIIIEGLNSTVEEVEKWLQMSNAAGITKIEFSMEFCRSLGRKTGKPIEQYNYELFDYAKKRCEELGIEFSYNYISQELMECGVYP